MVLCFYYRNWKKRQNAEHEVFKTPQPENVDFLNKKQHLQYLPCPLCPDSSVFNRLEGGYEVVLSLHLPDFPSSHATCHRVCVLYGVPYPLTAHWPTVITVPANLAMSGHSLLRSWRLLVRSWHFLLKSGLYFDLSCIWGAGLTMPVKGLTMPARA